MPQVFGSPTPKKVGIPPQKTFLPLHPRKKKNTFCNTTPKFYENPTSIVCHLASKIFFHPTLKFFFATVLSKKNCNPYPLNILPVHPRKKIVTKNTLQKIMSPLQFFQFSIRSHFTLCMSTFVKNTCHS